MMRCSEIPCLRLSGVKGFVSACLVVVSPAALALQPLVTDDTGTQGAGGHQLEVAYGRDRTRAGGETERTHSLPVVYTFGLVETLDVFAGLAPTRIRSSVDGGDASGWSNAVLGAKWRVLESEASGTSFAVKPELALPVKASHERDGLGTGRASGALTFILSQAVPFGAVHVNAVAGRDRYRHSSDIPAATYRRFSVAPVWEVSEQWKLALDLGVESARSDGATVRSRFAELGAIYSPGKDVDLALGFIRTTDNDQPKSTTHGVTAGVTWRF